MKMWKNVRRSVLTDKMSKRAACKKYKIHWDTLQKILANPEPPTDRRKAEREKPVLGPYVPWIHDILEADKSAPKKQRHTAKRIFERLRDDHGYTGKVTVVRDAVRAWKQKQQEPFLPLSHKPGEAQFDFGEAKVIYRGREMKAAFFVMSLPYSDAFFCQAFPRECTETFQEGHRRAFEFFRGVPYRISYDNTKIAVAKIVGRRGDTPTRELLRLESHYLFGHHFCLVRRPNEKGHTENLVGFARRNFMVPIPRFDDFEQFNESLAEACLKDLGRKLRGTTGTKQELLEGDRSAMFPLPPAPFEDWNLPGPFGLMRQRLEGSLGQDERREFIKILRLLEKHPMGRLTAAIERALQIHATTADAVAILIQDGREVPAKYFSLDGRPHLQGHDVPVPKLDSYDKLRAQEGGRS